jgi:hypothetical protein
MRRLTGERLTEFYRKRQSRRSAAALPGWEAMIEPVNACEFDEEDVLATEVTDATLEAAGAPPQNGGAFTANLCTVMADCGS